MQNKIVNEKIRVGTETSTVLGCGPTATKISVIFTVSFIELRKSFQSPIKAKVKA